MKRYRQIINILARYGFSEVLVKFNKKGVLKWTPFSRRRFIYDVNAKSSYRLRLALEELGPAFIKIGQLLSTRSDVIPEDFIVELSKLQDDVTPVPAEQVVELIESELGISVDDEFAFFDMEPYAVASIGQVHKAVLATGEEVVVKIKKPGIDALIRQDLAILKDMAYLFENNTPWGKSYHVTDLAGEIENSVIDELDYKNEGRNTERFHRNFSGSEQVIVPRVFWEYTTKNILMMEYCEGRQLNRFMDLPDEDADLHQLAETIVESYLKQIFIYGFFHGDPHPGNILIVSSTQIVFIDFGICGTLSENLREKFQDILKALVEQRTEEVADGIIELGFTSEYVNRQELVYDIQRIQDSYVRIPFEDLVISDILREFLDTTRKHGIRMPHEFLLLVKTLIAVEGLVTRLNPGYRIMYALNKFSDIMKKNFLQRRKKQLNDLVFSYERLLTRIPSSVNRITDQAASGELKFKMEMANTGPVIKKMGNMVNRLSFSIVLGSLILGFSMLVGRTDLFLIKDFPVAEAFLVSAGVAGFWWLINVLKSE